MQQYFKAASISKHQPYINNKIREKILRVLQVRGIIWIMRQRLRHFYHVSKLKSISSLLFLIPGKQMFSCGMGAPTGEDLGWEGMSWLRLMTSKSVSPALRHQPSPLLDGPLSSTHFHLSIPSACSFNSKPVKQESNFPVSSLHSHTQIASLLNCLTDD